MTNSVDPDQTATIEQSDMGSNQFVSLLKFVSNVRQLFAADDFSRRNFCLCTGPVMAINHKHRFV